jgi:hypothetical protein
MRPQNTKPAGLRWRALILMEGALAFAVVLYPCGPQTGQTMFVDSGLPVEEFIDAECIASAGLFEAEQTAAHCCDDFGFTADDPPPRIGGGKVCNRERTSVRSDNVLNARTHLYGHFTLYST